MKRPFIPLLLIGVILVACTSTKKPAPLKSGMWRGVLTLNDSLELILPFNFYLTYHNDSAVMVIHNAEERIAVNEISYKGDSVIIRMPVFDSEFRCKLSGDTLLTGNWINHARIDKNIISFTGTYGETQRFDCPEMRDNSSFNGRWRCVFNPDMKDSTLAVGIFKQSGPSITGTFLTETGDYRYLEGSVFGKYMLLSGFDGSHAYVFHAEVMETGMIWGEFYSGIHAHKTWIAWKDSTFKLRNADSLTYLKPGSPKFNFSFPDIDGKNISLSDVQFKNKVVILQIMGSWCPNCIDETMFLSKFYDQYKSKGLEVVSLAFELSTDPEHAKHNLIRLKKKYNVGYDILLSGYLPKDADQALPMLNHIMSFPTTIFLDKNGEARKITTGYSGPATGAEYEKLVNETNRFVESLLKES